MELFKIACPSCATRLKVSHTSAIGQILGCPKCGSMVRVEPPAGWEPPVEAATAPSVAPESRPRRKLPGTPDLPETAGYALEDFEDIDSLLTGSPTSSVPKGERMKGKPRSTVRATPGKEAASPGIDARSASSRPPAAWMESGASLERKKFALQIGAVVTLVAVAIALVVILVTTLFKPDPNSLANENQPNSNSPGKSNAAPAKSVAENDSEPSKDSENSSGNASGDQPNRSGIGDGPVVSIPLKMIPPQLMIPTMDLAPLAATPNTPPGMEVANQAGPPPQDVGIIDQFGDLNDLLAGGENQLSMQQLADATGAERGQIGIGSIFVRKPAEVEIDVAARLKLPISKISFPETSILDAVRTLSEISLIPICYEIDLIEVEKIDLSRKIQWEQSETTVGQALDDLLRDQSLVAVPQTGYVLITTADRDQWMTREFDLDVLRTESPSIADRFAEFLQQAIARTSWQPAGGQGTIEVNGLKLTIHQTGPVLALIDQLVKKMAAAKSLISNPDDESANKVLQSRRVRSQLARQAGVTLKLDREQRLEKVLSTIAISVGTDVVVNWQALGNEGWTPQTEIPWESLGVPLEDKLRELADSMNLAIRAINEHTLQLTTNADAKQQLELEVYPCSDLLQKYSAEQLTKLFENVLGNQVDASIGMSATLESICQCWVAILPQRLHVQFEAGLNQLRKELAAAKK